MSQGHRFKGNIWVLPWILEGSPESPCWMNEGKENAWHRGIRNMDQTAARMRGGVGNHEGDHTDGTLDEFRLEGRDPTMQLRYIGAATVGKGSAFSCRCSPHLGTQPWTEDVGLECLGQPPLQSTHHIPGNTGNSSGRRLMNPLCSP